MALICGCGRARVKRTRHHPSPRLRRYQFRFEAAILDSARPQSAASPFCVKRPKMQLETLNFRLADIAIILATLLGPVLAVQTQKWLEARREVRARRVWAFRTLMATRAARISADHVAALNSIPIEFYGRSKELNKINDLWRQYMLHLSDRDLDRNLWHMRGNDLFSNLLQEIAVNLNYRFDKTHITNEIYFPEGHNAMERDQETIRRGLADLFSGSHRLPVDICTVPTDAESLKDWERIRKLLLARLERNTRPQEHGRPSMLRDGS